jgi:hypothetical protein
MGQEGKMRKIFHVNTSTKLPQGKAGTSALFKSANPVWGGFSWIVNRFNIRIRANTLPYEGIKRLYKALLYILDQNYIYNTLIINSILNCILIMTPYITLFTYQSGEYRII